MGPDVLKGRDARAAWRALSPEGRRAAWAAAKGGYSPGDPGIGLAAAAYARRRIRTLRIALGLLPIVVLVSVVALAFLALGYSHSSGMYFALVPVLLGAYIVAAVLLRIRVVRYRGMYSSGTLAVEAARAGMAGAPHTDAWQQSGHQSEFTVPYHAGVRIEAEPARQPADPARAGTHRIRVARGPFLVRYAVTVFFLVVIWLMFAVLSAGPPEFVPLLFVVLGVAVLFTLLAVASLLLNWPWLRDPTVVRLDPDGWSQPPFRTGGGWPGVREIRVRSYGGGSNRPTRAVVLVVDDPQEQLDRVPAARRWIARSAVRRYDSPIVITANHHTMLAPDLVALLRRYTDAPVTWG
jgi:hypothetical protein